MCVYIYVYVCTHKFCDMLETIVQKVSPEIFKFALSI